MKLLIVEDDPSLRKVLTELVQTEISDAEIIEADNLDDAVRLLHPAADCGLLTVDGILTDGTFPTWPQKVLPTSIWNASRPNWIGLAGWAEKKHIPLVVLTGAGEVFDHARRVGVPVFMKPLETHRAIACLRALVVPKALRENPVVTEMDEANEEAKRRKWEVGNRK
jgi:CheY-like chemotaxis protein